MPAFNFLFKVGFGVIARSSQTALVGRNSNNLAGSQHLLN
jgi:hypothetical protein